MDAKARRVRIGISGFGRIGKLVCRAALFDGHVNVVAINDPYMTLDYAACLLRHDSVHGTFPHHVACVSGNNTLEIRPMGRKTSRIKFFREKDPALIPWQEMGVDVVVEATGVFTKRVDLQKHLRRTVQKVVLTAPADKEEDADLTIVLGVNEEMYDIKRHHLVSNASCTTNCLAPILKLLRNRFGVGHGIMVTAHAFTNDQRLVDSSHRDWRRGRSAMNNVIPTKTGAAKAIGLVIPDLAGRIDGSALRVPVSDVSLVELVAQLIRTTTVEEINGYFEEAAKLARFKSLEYMYEPLVSQDLVGDPHSSVFDPSGTMVLGGNLVKIRAWYDNEWAYSCRVVDLAKYLMGIS